MTRRLAAIAALLLGALLAPKACAALDLATGLALPLHQATSATVTFPLDGVSVDRAYSICRLFSAYNGTLLETTAISGGTVTDFAGTSGGCVDWSAVATACPTASSCKATLYDQSGNAANTTNNTSGGAGVLVDAINHWLSFDGATNGNWLSFIGPAETQPYAIAANWEEVTHEGGDFLFSDSGTTQLIGGTNVTKINIGSALSAAMTSGAWAAVNYLVNGASSSITVNGTATGGTTGVASLASGTDTLGNATSGTFNRLYGYFDCFVIFHGEPGAPARAAFGTWMQGHLHT